MSTNTPDTQTGNMTDAQAVSALKQHGSKIIWAIALVLGAYFGWQFYQNNYGKFDTALADNYAHISERNDALNLGLQNPDLDDNAKAELNKEQESLFKDIDDLVAKSPNTAYAWQALMIKARHQADSEQYKEATETLKKAVAIDVADDGLKAIAGLRLAQAQLADNDLDTALATANTAMPKAFEPSRQELLGDIYLAKDDEENAKKAYEQAWQALSERQEVRSILSLKMQSLGMTPSPIMPKPSVVEVPELPQVASQTAETADKKNADTAKADAGETAETAENKPQIASDDKKATQTP